MSTNTKLKYTYGNIIVNRATYTPYGFLTSQTSGSISNPKLVQDFTYSFNHANGNLRQRISGTLTENFRYDGADRLLTDKNNTLTYNTNNNIGSKTGLGTYSYNTSKIHRLNSVQNISSVLPNTALRINITPFNKTRYIANSSDSIAFIYGVDQERTSTMQYKNGALVLTKYFAGNYEREVAGSTTRHLHYIDAPTGLAAIWVRSTTSGVSKDTLYYIHTDHLGSITAVTSQYTTTPKKYSYDAWGRRRNATNWAYTGATAPVFSRGYTGHEHIDVLGIINMNGRMYDPRLGMFLSPDPYLQAPGNALNYNRYSYCLNNPLKYTDPSGEFFLGSIITTIFEYQKSMTKTFYGFFKTLYTEGGLDITNVNIMKKAWADYNIKDAKNWQVFGTRVSNAFKIDGGLFNVNTDNSGWGWEIMSRFTWQAPQVIAGNLLSHGYNLSGNVTNVEYYEGTTVVTTNPNGNSAITIGNYIAGSVVADWRDHRFVHEYGHYLQSQEAGLWYLPTIGLMSLASAKLDRDFDIGDHRLRWFETDASLRGGLYFDNKYGSGAQGYVAGSADYFDFNAYVNGGTTGYRNPRTRRFSDNSRPIQHRFQWSDLLLYSGFGAFVLFL